MDREDFAELLARPGTASAQRPGVCADCGEPFAAGTPIVGRAEPGHRQPIVRDGRPAWRSLLCCGGAT